MQSGLWTFEVVALLRKQDNDETGKGVCLFAAHTEVGGGWGMVSNHVTDRIFEPYFALFLGI